MKITNDFEVGTRHHLERIIVMYPNGTINENVGIYNEMDCKHMYQYEFNVVGSEIYNFVWSDFCDWYIELSKRIKIQQQKQF